MHAVEVAMPQTRGAWCQLVKGGRSDLKVQVDAFVAMPEGRMVEFVTLRGKGIAHVVGLLRERLGVGSVRLLDEGPDHAQIRLEVDQCPLARVMNASGLVPRLPFTIEDGWDRWVVVDQKAALKQAMGELQDQHGQNGDLVIPLKVLRSGPIRRSNGLLTPNQHRVLEAAIEEGYYDAPRRTTIRALAARLGISKSTLSETLMTVERKVMHRFADGVESGKVLKRAPPIRTGSG